jgi:outer membrane lipoprotein-sorting protein
MRAVRAGRLRILGAAVLGAASAIALVATTPTGADPGEPADLDDIAAIPGTIRTLRARFVQRRRLELFAEELVSRGGFYFKRPDRFRWDVEEPVRASMIVTDGRILTTDGEGAHAHAVPLPVSAREIAGLLTGSVEILRGLFAVEGRPSAAGGDDERLVLRPLEPALARTVRAVTLDLAPREKYVRRIVLDEQSGDRMEIRFDDVEINGELPDELFTFEQKGTAGNDD